jgi:hypothetical protein
MNKELTELATDTLAVLSLQQEYFRTKDTNVLARCKQAESALRRRCKDILAGKVEEPNLFAGAASD